MTNPATEEAASQDTFEDKVTLALSTAERDNAGKLKFSEDTPEDVAYAANSERRLRDTQASYTKGQQSHRALELEIEELHKHISGNTQMKLTPEQIEELDDIKHSDPDAWRSRLNGLEAKAKSEHAKEVGERIKTVSAEGAKTVELEQRSKALQEFQQRHPDFVINDDIIANDLPPRFLKALDNDEVDINDFLQNAYDYLTKEKVVGDGQNTLDQPNLSNAGGTDSPSDSAVTQAASNSYDKTIF